MDGSARADRRDELSHGRARAGWQARCARAGPVYARRHRAVPGVRRTAGAHSRTHARPGACAADGARCAPSARLRPCRTRRRERDVRVAAPTARGVGGRPGRGLPPGPPDRKRSPAAGQISLLRRAVTGIGSLLGAIALIFFGGLFAAIDAAISTVSIARVEELVRDERPGAVRLARVIHERPRFINLVVLLRIACEITATALLVDYLYEHLGLDWGLVL